MRQFIDADGIEWQVFEVRRTSGNESAVTPGRESGWLAFASPLERRRLAPVPAEWQTIAEEKLAELCTLSTRVELRHGDMIYDRRSTPRVMMPDAATQEDTDPDLPLLVTEHARDCRTRGATVVDGLMSLRKKIVERQGSPDDFEQVRKQFVDAFYFGRRDVT